MQSWTPTLAQRWIASELQRLRLATGTGQESAAKHLGVSRVRLSDLESANAVPRERDFEILLQLYNASHRIAEFVELREIAKKRNWWSTYKAVPKWFSRYLGLEESASEINAWNYVIIHDLLQTEEYAGAQIRETMPDAIAKEVADQVDIRMRRQQVWLGRGNNRAHLRVILSESALRLPMGSATVMRDQYDYLLQLASSTVELHVLPFIAGGHAAPFSPFTLLRFDIPNDQGVFYTENADGGRYSEHSRDLAATTELFASLRAKALNQAESIEFISALKVELDIKTTGKL